MGVIRQALVNAFLPWTASLTGDLDFEAFVLFWFVFLVVLRRLVMLLPPTTYTSKEITKRPTIVVVMLHSLVCSLASFAVIVPAGTPTDDSIPNTVMIWRRGVLSFSTAYWLFDLIYYCYPREDFLIAVHHIAILVCNYPIGDAAGVAALETLNPQCTHQFYRSRLSSHLLICIPSLG